MFICVPPQAYPVHASLRSQVEEQINSIFKVILFYTPTAMLCAINFLFGIGMEGFYTLYWFYMGHKGFETTATNSLYSLYSIAQVGRMNEFLCACVCACVCGVCVFKEQ